MNRCALIPVALVAAFCFGCATNNDANDPLAKEGIRLTNALADEMEKMAEKPDEKSIAESQQKITKLSEDLDAVANKIQKLPTAEQNVIDRKFKKEMEAANQRVRNAGARLGIKMPPK